MWVSKASTLLAVALAFGMSVAVQAQTAGRITGVGGVFFKSKDPKALARWYRDVLGLPVETWGGAMLRYDAPGHPPMVVWTPYPKNTDEIAPPRASS